MRYENHYEVLGLPQYASAEEIEQAYQAHIAFRYSGEAQDTLDREALEDQARRVHRAYELLRDPSTRADHDRQLAKRDVESVSPAAPVRVARTVRATDRRMFSLEAGEYFLGDLPPEIQRRLRDRVAGTAPNQLAFKVEGIGANITGMVLAIGWLVMACLMSKEIQVGADYFSWLAVITVLVGGALAYNVSALVRFLTSPLRRWLLVTPLYVVSTRFEKVRYWPVAQFTGSNSIHQYVRGVYLNTEMFLSFGKTSVKFVVRPQKVPVQVHERILENQNKLLAAERLDDPQQLVPHDEHDIFPDSGHATPGSAKKPGPWRSLFIFTILFVLYAAIFALAAHLNRPQF